MMSEKTTKTTKIKVKCIARYHDTKLNRSVEVGETLEVTKERAEVLREAKVAE